MIRPETTAVPLKKGDEFIIAASSSIVSDKDALDKGLKIFEDWGLICKQNKILGRHFGYLAGDDATRFQELYPNKVVPLTVFARGGWGAARLLEKSHPWESGWMIGYSDVTSLLLARLSKGFDGCIHGPLVTSLAKEPEWSKERLKNILFGKSIPDIYGESWNSGIATGPLIVGNLTVLSHLIGSRYTPNFQDAILILEDINEEPYRIDRMLTHLRLAGILQKLSGIGFGIFQNCKDLDDIPNNQGFTLSEILKDRCKDLNIPIVNKLPIGHCCGNAALPLGHIAILDGYKARLSFAN